MYVLKRLTPRAVCSVQADQKQLNKSQNTRDTTLSAPLIIGPYKTVFEASVERPKGNWAALSKLRTHPSVIHYQKLRFPLFLLLQFAQYSQNSTSLPPPFSLVNRPVQLVNQFVEFSFTSKIQHYESQNHSHYHSFKINIATITSISFNPATINIGLKLQKKPQQHDKLKTIFTFERFPTPLLTYSTQKKNFLKFTLTPISALLFPFQIIQNKILLKIRIFMVLSKDDRKNRLLIIQLLLVCLEWEHIC